MGPTLRPRGRGELDSFFHTQYWQANKSVGVSAEAFGVRNCGRPRNSRNSRHCTRILFAMTQVLRECETIYVPAVNTQPAFFATVLEV
jgi:hypothetical protein